MSSSHVFSFGKKESLLQSYLPSKCRTGPALLCQEMLRSRSWCMYWEPRGQAEDGTGTCWNEAVSTLEHWRFLFNLPWEQACEGRGSDPKQSRAKSRRDRNKCRVYGRDVTTKRWLGGGDGMCFVFTNISGTLCGTQCAWLYTQR